jgi:hypothetical protein
MFRKIIFVLMYHRHKLLDLKVLVQQKTLENSICFSLATVFYRGGGGDSEN